MVSGFQVLLNKDSSLLGSGTVAVSAFSVLVFIGVSFLLVSFVTFQVELPILKDPGTVAVEVEDKGTALEISTLTVPGVSTDFSIGASLEVETSPIWKICLPPSLL